MPTKDEMLNRLDEFSWFHFPDEGLPGNPPYWGQSNYRDELFDFCREAVGVLCGDDMAHHVLNQWNIQREHPLLEDDEERLEKLILAWSEWQYAIRRLQQHGH